MILSTTRTIAELPHLATFLAGSPDAVAGWGRKTSGQRAVWLSRVLRRPLALLEDGFIRSVDRSSPPLSLLVDDLGVYYDAAKPSRMERSIALGIDEASASRAAALAFRWRQHRISKYNHAREYRGDLPDRYVLVVDQIWGDLSVLGGLADDRRFAQMLAAALHENGAHTVVVKVHPDVLNRAKRGYFDIGQLNDPRIAVIGDDCHCTRLIENASAVYCVTSLMGFEALLWGKAVRCFGMPFYAGWGLTRDEQRAPSRRHKARFEDVVHAALIGLARYADPKDGTPWDVEQTIDYVATARAERLHGERVRRTS